MIQDIVSLGMCLAFMNKCYDGVESILAGLGNVQFHERDNCLERHLDEDGVSSCMAMTQVLENATLGELCMGLLAGITTAGHWGEQNSEEEAEFETV